MRTKKNKTNIPNNKKVNTHTKNNKSNTSKVVGNKKGINKVTRKEKVVGKGERGKKGKGEVNLNTNILKKDGQTTKKLETLASAVTSRAMLQSKLGLSFEGDRKLYEALGYPTSISFPRYDARYKRQDIAKRVVNAYPEASWAEKPILQENNEAEETNWEKEIRLLFKKKKIYHFLRRADKLAGIGEYSVLFLGFDDGADFSEEVTRASNLLYLHPYKQNHADIKTYESDKKNERYGLPKTYEINLSDSSSNSGVQQEVHWTRILHIAEGCAESNVLGTPRMEAVYNRLQDIELLAGGSAEMFWKGAFPGYAFNADSDAELPDKEDMEDEIETYFHGLNRYLRLRGIETKELKPQVASPKAHLDLQLKLISSATKIPTRILIGSERGELASSQDERNWLSAVDERRRDFVAPMILEPLIDRLIKVGVVGEADYEIIYSDSFVLGEVDKSEIAKNKSEALNKYVSAPGADLIIPPEHFLKYTLEMDQETIDAITDSIGEIQKAEEDDLFQEEEGLTEE